MARASDSGAAPHVYRTLDCGCVLGQSPTDLLFVDPHCLERAATGRSAHLRHASARESALIARRLMELHEQDQARRRVTTGRFSSAGAR
jgi:hypothetical protein